MLVSQLVTLDHLDDLDHLDHLDNLDHLDHLDHLDNLDHVDHLDHMDHYDHSDHLDKLDHLDDLNHLVHLTLSMKNVDPECAGAGKLWYHYRQGTVFVLWWRGKKALLTEDLYLRKRCPVPRCR